MKHRKEYKKYCVEQHRKMWHWITKEYRKGRMELASFLKAEYLARFLPEMKTIENDCFCCEYDSNAGSDDCHNCPLIWGEKEEAQCTDREYRKLQEIQHEFLRTREWNGTKCVELAEQIANLPEREGV